MDDLFNWELPAFEDPNLDPISAEPGVPAPDTTEPAESASPVIPSPTQETAPVSDEKAAPSPLEESIADRSRRLVMSALGETLRQYREKNPAAQPQEASPAAGFAAYFQEDAAGTASGDVPASQEADVPETAGVPEKEPGRREPVQVEPARASRPRFSMGEDGIITLLYDSDAPVPQPDETPEPEAEEAAPEAEEASEPEQDAAPEQDIEPEEPPMRAEPVRTRRAPRRPRFRAADIGGMLLGPFIRIAAAQQARRQQQAKEARSWPEPEKEPETPELSPKNAAKYYAARSKSLRWRFRVSLFLTLILAWIALGLPMAGMLGRSTPLQAGVSLVLTLTVMLAALDTVTLGLRQLFDLAPGPEALAFLSALLSCVDAALILLGFGTFLPFCAVGAAALTAALFGDRLYCLALMRSFRTAAASHDPTFAVAEAAKDAPRRLHRTARDSMAGFIRRSEGQDPCHSAYSAASVVILLAALLLSAAASLNGKGANFLHTLSALISVGTSFAAFFGFSLPYSITARRLRSSGAAIAGFPGCMEIAKTRELVLTDSDIFPPGTMKITGINILEGVPQHRVIIAACSLLFAADGGVAPLFEELAERRDCRVPPPREFTVHESGGLTGIVNGEHADVGPARFMNLQGIRLPHNIPARNTVCVALDGELVGVFEIGYTPVTSVQEALVSLLRGRITPVFAVRDFNITPKMIHDLFKLPSANFNFPTYRDRSRIKPDDGQPISAVISRRGMLPFVETAEAGRRLYTASRLITILSLIGSAIGMVIVFLLCRTEAFDTASVRNVLSFMLLWSLPAVILSYGRGK